MTTEKSVLARVRTSHFFGRGLGTNHVAAGSFWMLAATASVSIGSFFFWLIASRQTDADVVGRASGLFSAVFFLAFASNLGLPTAVARYGATNDPLHVQRFRAALVATVVMAVIVATIFYVLDPNDLLNPVRSRGTIQGWFILSSLAAGAGVSVLVDTRLTGLRRWTDVFWRSTAISVVRLPLIVPALKDETGFWLFAVAASVYALTSLPYLPSLVRGTATTWDGAAHLEALRYSAVNYIGQIAAQAPLFATPLLVALTVDDSANATFYLAWGMMTVVYLAVHLLGRTLLVEASKREGSLRKQVMTSLLVGTAVTVPALVLSVPAGPILVFLYGEQHAQISEMLPLLMLGTVPWVLTRTTLAVARALDQTIQTLLVAIWSSVAVMSAVVIAAAVGGARTAALGWAIGCFASIPVALPVLRRLLKGQP